MSGATAWSTYQMVTDERYVTRDWASGYTKFQCPDGGRLIGYALRGAAMSSTLCAIGQPVATDPGRTVWFDRGDNRPDRILPHARRAVLPSRRPAAA